MKLAELKARATARGEWVVISHDATFKCTFSIMGQVAMAQREGEVHAAHTFVGVSGACPGFSLQPKEGRQSFEAAVDEIFTPDMKQQVRLVFSDKPSESMLAPFPNAEAVAEDFLHLPFRAEYASGGRRTALSREVRALQNKFRVPLAERSPAWREMLYHGEGASAWCWDNTQPAKALSDAAWNEYLGKPFGSHSEYIAQLRRVAQKYPGELNKKDKKGRTVHDILKAGSSYNHYRYLLNSSIFVALAGAQLVPGTARNEAEHRQIKRWMTCIYGQYQDRLQYVAQVYGLCRMLSNAHKQMTGHGVRIFPEKHLLHLLFGLITSGGLRTATTQRAAEEPAPASSRLDLKRPRSSVPEEMAASNRARAQMRQDSFEQELLLKKRKRQGENKGVNARHGQSSAVVWTNVQKGLLRGS